MLLSLEFHSRDLSKHVLSGEYTQSTDHDRITRSTPSRQTTPIWPTRSSTGCDSRRTIIFPSDYAGSSRRGYRMSVCGALGGCMMVRRVWLYWRIMSCPVLLCYPVGSRLVLSTSIPSHPIPP